MRLYQHTQTAWWMFFVLLPALALAGVSVGSAAAGAGPAALVTALVIFALLAIFTRLTIRVDAQGVRWAMGYGWPGGFISAAEIANAAITRTNVLEGWGIHWTMFHGWLWNVGGFQAVQISKTNGATVTLGTDDPEGLLAAITAAEAAS